MLWSRQARLLPLVLVLACPQDAGAATVDAALQARINKAVDAGVAWLLHTDVALASEPSRQSYPLGADVLVYYTLLTCGVAKDRPELLELEERTARAPYLVDQTYSLAIALLALLKADPEKHRAVIVLLISRLEAGQFTSGVGKGAWGYQLPEGQTVAPGPTTKPRISGAHWPAPRDWWDNSNTQYAVLALRAAVDHGFAVSDHVFARAAEHFLTSQDASGGIGYGVGHREAAYCSMTAGGLGALAMCADVLDTKQYQDLHRRIEHAMGPGSAWLGSHLRWPAVDSAWPFYAAYAVERFGHYGHFPLLGGHDWYADGARWLVESQGESGAFSTNAGAEGRAVSGTPVDTCFALLFLKKASAVHTQESDEILVILKSLDPQAPEADVARVRNRILEVGQPALAQLVKGLFLENAIARDLADECLRGLTHEDFGIAAARTDAELREARQRWVKWVMAQPGYRKD